MDTKTPKEERDEIIKNVTNACSNGAKRVLEIYEKLIHNKTGIDIKIEYRLECFIPNKLIDEIYINRNYSEKFNDTESIEEVEEIYKWKM